jgi:hypothetical protein
MNKSGTNLADIQIDVDDQSMNDTRPIKLTKRYCWNRLSKVQFIIVISLVTFVFLFLVALAVGYIFIIPGSTPHQTNIPVVLPKIFWGFVFNGNWSGLVLNELNWVDADEEGFYFKLFMTSKALTLPVRFLSGETLPSMLM